jgi:hypothetical protein
MEAPCPREEGRVRRKIVLFRNNKSLRGYSLFVYPSRPDNPGEPSTVHSSFVQDILINLLLNFFNKFENSRFK